MASVPFTRESAAAYTDRMIAAYLAAAVETAGRVTDFNAGSVLRTTLEAAGVGLERLDLKAFLGLKRAIPTAIYDSFGDGDGVTTTVGFPLLPAIASAGIVRFERQAGILGTIPIDLGTELHVPAAGSTPEKLYQTIVPATLGPSDAFVETLAQCAVAGTLGNTAANTMELRGAATGSPLTGLAGATNPQAFLSGADAETEAGRFVRFLLYIRNLARSQDAGLERGALRALVLTGGSVVERVLFARAIPVANKRGLVDVYLDNGGGSASDALVVAAQTLLDGSYATDGSRIAGYKAAGIVVRAQAVRPRIVDVACAISLARGYTLDALRPAITTAIAQYLFGLGVFADCIRAELIGAITRVRGVTDVAITTPAANVSTTTGDRIVAGAITVTSL